jgi:hypothetical protein
VRFEGPRSSRGTAEYWVEGGHRDTAQRRLVRRRVRSIFGEGRGSRDPLATGVSAWGELAPVCGILYAGSVVARVAQMQLAGKGIQVRFGPAASRAECGLCGSANVGQEGVTRDISSTRRPLRMSAGVRGACDCAW